MGYVHLQYVFYNPQILRAILNLTRLAYRDSFQGAIDMPF